MGTTESIFYDDSGEHEQHDAAEADHSTPSTHRKVQRQSPMPPPPSTARRRNLPQATEKRPLFQLHVSILGLPKSGKQTLLHRLRGKDPFSAIQEHQSTSVVPYQSPRPVEDRIQLSVQIHRQGGDENLQKTDLAILLVDPRHDRERIEQSITEAVQFVWRKTNSETNKPFRLCILVNFWDKVYKSEKKQRKTQVAESDVQQMTIVALQGLSTDVEPSRLHLQCTTTSLFNCYGLGTLHFFMYQSYLLLKQWNLQNTLQAIQQSLKRSRESVPQVISYEAYLKQLRNPAPVPSPDRPNEPPSQDPSQDSSKMHGHRRAVVVPSESNKNKPTASLQNAEASRKALEAFLADDDDEDDGGLRKQQSIYDSDDDSEVFIDEAGQRQVTGQYHSRTRATIVPPAASETADRKPESNGTVTPVKSRDAGRPIQNISTNINHDRVSQSVQATPDIRDTAAETRNVSGESHLHEDSDSVLSGINVLLVASGTMDIKTLGSRDEESVKADEEPGSHTSNSNRGSVHNESVVSPKDIQTEFLNEKRVEQDTHPTVDKTDDEDNSEISEEVIVGNDAIPKMEEGGDDSEFFVDEEEDGAGDAAKPSYESLPDASTSAIRKELRTPSRHVSVAEPKSFKDTTTKEPPAAEGTIPSQVSSSQMSPAVLAAIAAAQQEAEEMLQQQLLQEKEKKSHDKKPKKEKKKKEKKEKKKKEGKTETEGDQSD